MRAARVAARAHRPAAELAPAVRVLDAGHDVAAAPSDYSQARWAHERAQTLVTTGLGEARTLDASMAVVLHAHPVGA